MDPRLRGGDARTVTLRLRLNLPNYHRKIELGSIEVSNQLKSDITICSTNDFQL